MVTRRLGLGALRYFGEVFLEISVTELVDGPRLAQDLAAVGIL